MNSRLEMENQLIRTSVTFMARRMWLHLMALDVSRCPEREMVS